MINSKKIKNWLEIKVEIPRAFTELVSAFLFSQGSTGFIQEKISRNKERLIAYFPEERSFNEIERGVCSYFSTLGEFPSFKWQSKIIKEERWAESWKSNFHLVKISPHLVIKPPWENYHKRQKEIVLQINPGLAFGTGTHETTQMCLRFLDKLIPGFFPQPYLLDVGTGSGILAIAALKLGAKKILAIDIDPLALEAAQENAKLNKITKGINFCLASPDQVSGKFNLVVANLLPQELLAAKDSLVARVSQRGALIISGFLKKQKKEISSAFAEYGLKVWQKEELNGWVSFVLKRLREK